MFTLIRQSHCQLAHLDAAWPAPNHVRVPAPPASRQFTFLACLKPGGSSEVHPRQSPAAHIEAMSCKPGPRSEAIAAEAAAMESPALQWNTFVRVHPAMGRDKAANATVRCSGCPVTATKRANQYIRPELEFPAARHAG